MVVDIEPIRTIMNMAGKIQNPLVLTGGGDCSPLNAALRAIVKSLINLHGIKRVLGSEDSFRGVYENRFRVLDYDSVANILTRPGSILGNDNKFNPFKLMIEGIEKDVSDVCIENLKSQGIDSIIVIGGDGTMSIASRFIEKFEKLGIEILVIGVPKTIDRDVFYTDTTIGFDTAVRQLTQFINDIRSTAESHHRIFVIEAMGRNSGALALYAGAASGADIILLPEIAYNIDEICRVVKKRSEKGRRYTIIVVAEGAKETGGEKVIERIIKDSPDPIRYGGIAGQLSEVIEKKTGLDCRSAEPGHFQRGGAPTPGDINLATLLGYSAVEMLMKGYNNRIAVVQNGTIASSVSITSVADRQKEVPVNHPLIKASLAVGISFGNPTILNQD
ncbi:MAG: ATP-dependent 6-phosphofructokinase [Nanoarchaeota archaeon]|nr:ATP-dependent 6-phosphofructokinase [Nanoarchaeota archaeon]